MADSTTSARPKTDANFLDDGELRRAMESLFFAYRDLPALPMTCWRISASAVPITG